MNRIQNMGVISLSILVLSCGGEPTDRSTGPIVRDSAGVRIVENGANPVGSWRVGSEPLFTVGWDEAGPLFTWIQSGRILPSGGAIIGEYGEKKIYELGPDGEVVGIFGREGEGPGEYERLDAILLLGDTIVVSDGRLRRVTILPPDGSPATKELSGTFLHRISETFSDGRLLLVPGDGYSALSETRPEWVFETQPILAQDRETGTVTTLAELPHLRRWYGDRGGSPGPVHVKGRAGGFPEGFAWARSDEPAVLWFDPTGELVQVAKWDELPGPLTAEWKDAMRQMMEDSFRSSGADDAFVTAQLSELEAMFDLHGGPLPYWGEMSVDRMGNVWLGQYTLPGEIPEQWRVLDRGGVFRSKVDLPGLAVILDITRDRILGVGLDELDVPAVMMFELKKN